MEMAEISYLPNCSCCQHKPPLNYFPAISYCNSHPFHCCQCCPSCPYCQQNRLAFGFCVPTCSSCPPPHCFSAPPDPIPRLPPPKPVPSKPPIDKINPKPPNGQPSKPPNGQPSKSPTESSRNIDRVPTPSINPAWSDPKLYGSAFQSLVPTFATTAMVQFMIVRIIGGGNIERAQVIQASLFTMGISTLLQVWFGTRLPVIMQSSKNFIIPIIAISLSSASKYNPARFSKIDNTLDFNRQIFKESIKRIQGATIIGAIFQIIIGFSCLGEIFARYLSPLTIVPLVTLTGIGLFRSGFPLLANCDIGLGLPALVLLVFSTQYLPHIWKSRKEFLDQYSVAFSIAILWAYAEILNQAGAYNNNASYTDQGIEFGCASNSGVVDVAPWIKIPLPFPYGGPTFEFGDAFLIMAACFVDAIESAGTYIATSTLAGANPIPPFALSRGIGLQGIGTLVNALLGTGGGSTASVVQAGLVGLTQLRSRRVVLVSATLMLLCSIIGKVAALLASIPLPIEVAVQMVLLPYVASTGLDYLQFCNMNSFRLMFIIGISIFMGLSVPQYFYEYVLISSQGPVRTSSTWFNDTVRVIFSSPPTVGVIIAFFLDRTHTPKDSSTRKDNGWYWKDLWDEIGKIDTTYSIISNIDDLCS